MTACEHNTYADYCAYNAARGCQVIPERLWNALKKVLDSTQELA